MRRRLSAAAVALTALVLTSACGSSETPSGETRTIEVTLEGDAATPAGDRVDVAVGQRVDLVVTADRPGEIHVHTSPEQTFEFGAGTNDPIELVIDRPGLVEVEFHEPIDGVIVELKVQ